MKCCILFLACVYGHLLGHIMYTCHVWHILTRARVVTHPEPAPHTSQYFYNNNNNEYSIEHSQRFREWFVSTILRGTCRFFNRWWFLFLDAICNLIARPIEWYRHNAKQSMEPNGRLKCNFRNRKLRIRRMFSFSSRLNRFTASTSWIA